MKVALVCDWLTNVGGAEKVLLELHRMYPEAPIYTSKYDPAGIDWFTDADVRTGWLNKFPTKLRRVLGPLRQRYFSRLDLTEYDLIISVTGAEAKAVKSGRRRMMELADKSEWKRKRGVAKIKNPRGVHISYCHVPTQYYWQMYDEYIRNPGFGVLNPLVRLGFKMLVVPLRRADLRAAQRPDEYVTISEYAKEQIRYYYGREAIIIHPPVEVEDFAQNNTIAVVDDARASGDVRTKNGVQEVRAEDDDKRHEIGKYYVVTSRQVNWKRLDIAIQACLMTQRKLKVIGEGPEHKKLVKMAEGTNLIKFLPLARKQKLAEYLAEAKGYLFPSLEPFGIAPVEALAAGCPVIAYGEGGARDYIKDGKNGVLFDEQSARAMAEAILKYEKLKFDRAKVARSVKNYGAARFEKEVRKFVSKTTK